MVPMEKPKNHAPLIVIIIIILLGVAAFKLL
jgi:hypothetical protein